jgi:hypothetical protein
VELELGKENVGTGMPGLRVERRDGMGRPVGTIVGSGVREGKDGKEMFRDGVGNPVGLTVGIGKLPVGRMDGMGGGENEGLPTERDEKPVPVGNGMTDGVDRVGKAGLVEGSATPLDGTGSTSVGMPLGVGSTPVGSGMPDGRDGKTGTLTEGDGITGTLRLGSPVLGGGKTEKESPTVVLKKGPPGGSEKEICASATPWRRPRARMEASNHIAVRP